ncbi:MAG: IS66 family transposase [Candidatus Omnitrophica bacterium]|nr:IS66 family transposase [Candidatus Omnitrophota bacterium]
MPTPFVKSLETISPEIITKKPKNRRVITCRKARRCMPLANLKEENATLTEHVKELERQIKDLRRSLYGKRKKKTSIKREPKKKGAPFGHKGVTRPKPQAIDEEIEVRPHACPCCGNEELILTGIEPEEHIQEDIVLPKRKVTKYVKPVFKCGKCNRLVRGGLGEGEIPNAYIGPQAKAFANYLRYSIGIPQHKIKKIFQEMFDLPFDQTSVPGFENQLTRRAQPIYDEMRSALLLMKLLYIDETGWKKDGILYWLWCYSNKILVFYHIDKSRGGKVVTAILGEKFNGMIISDFLRAYAPIKSLKQKCIPHVLRMIERYYRDQRDIREFCEELKGLMKRVIYLFKHRTNIKDYLIRRASLIVEIKNLLSREVAHQRTDEWRNRLLVHQEELYECLFHPKSDFNNNFVERMLRPSVIMRKITFGNRSERGIKNHSVIMSLLQTARLHNHHPAEIFYQIFTKPDDVRLANLIRAP